MIVYSNLLLYFSFVLILRVLRFYHILLIINLSKRQKTPSDECSSIVYNKNSKNIFKMILKMQLNLFVLKFQQKLNNSLNNIIGIVMNNNSNSRSLSLIHIVICINIGLIFIFGSAIFVALTYYGDSIDSKIQELSILKDYQQNLWGKQPNSRGAVNTISIAPYNITIQNGSLLSQPTNSTVTLDYVFQYKNVTFAQGNSGKIKLLNNWRLQNPSYIHQSSQNISTLNLAAQKIYSNEYYSPMVRKFVLLYNDLTKNLENVFLNQFYAKYLYQYYFKDQNLVYKSMFKRLGFSENDFNAIYTNPQYGMNSSQTLEQWTRIVLAENPYDSISYSKIRKAFQFSHQTMLKITGKQSVFGHLVLALNGSIQNKFSAQRTFDLPCQKTICSNSQLVTGQLAASILLGSAIFPSLSLDSSLMQFNITLPHQLQYDSFCNNNPDLNCLDKQNLMIFFRKNIFTSFPISVFISQNKQKIDYIEKELDLSQGTGQSIVKYFEFLSNLFNKNQNANNKDYNEDRIFWSLTNYHYHSRSINLLKDTLEIELYSRAFFNQFITANRHKCQQYFTDSLTKYQKIFCGNKNYNFSSLQTIRNILSVYLQIQSPLNLQRQTNITSEDLYILFNAHTAKQNQQISLFAAQMFSLQLDISNHYHCAQIICQGMQLLSIEWGSNEVLNNLPPIYFAKQNATLAAWDSKNIFKGKNIQYWSIANQKISKQNSQKMLSTDSQLSLTNLFSLMNIFDNGDKKILAYIQTVVLEVFFEGLVIQRNLEKLIMGTSQQVLQQITQRPVLEGGTPWLSKTASFMPMNNKQRIQYCKFADLFDQLNTGIYDQDLTRQINKIQGLKTSSSLYTIYRPKQQVDDNAIFIRLKTDKQIVGSNIYGFQPNLSKDENLKVYLPLAYQSVVLVYQESMNYPDSSSSIEALKYIIDNQNFISIAIEQQNNRQIKISPQSYLIADQKTGLALQFNIKFTMYSTPIFGTFLVKNQNNTRIPIYEGQFKYDLQNLDKIQEVYSINSSMHVTSYVFIGLAVLCMVIIVILTIIYFVKRRKESHKKQSLLDEAQSGSSSTVN